MSETQTRDATETAPPPEQQAPAEQVEQPAAEHTEHAAPPAPDADDANDTNDTDEQDGARGFPAGQVTLGALSVLTIAGVLAFQAIGLIGLVAAGAVATGGAAMLVRRRLGHAAQARRTRTRTTRTAWSTGRSGGSRGLLSGGLLGGRSRGRSGRRGGGLLGGRSGGKRGGLLGGRSGGKGGGLLGGRSGGKGRGASRLGMTGAGGRGRRGGGSGKRVGRSRVRPGKSGRTLGPPPIGTTVRPPKGRGARGGASRGAKGGARGGARGGGSAGTRSAHRSTGRVGARARRAGRTAARRVDAMTGGRASKVVRKVAGKHSPARRAARRTGRVINRATGGRAGRWWRRNRRRTKRGATLAGLTAGFFAVFMAPAWLLVAAGGALMATAVGLFASERRAKKRKTGPKSKTGAAGHGTQNASASTAGEPPLTGIPVGPPVRDPRRARTNPRNPWRNALEAGFPLAVAAAEMNPVAAAYAPENMWVVGVDLRQLPEVFTQVAMALRTYAQRLEGDYPIHPQVVEAIGQLYIGLGGLAESAQEIEALFRALHADDLKREEAPRVNEPAWNV